MLKTFIERPVLSTVISTILVILGGLGILSLPIEQYPDIAPPTIVVKAKYTGADANTVLKSVIIPIEEQINGVEDMIYMTSIADNNGSANIKVYFKQGTDADMAAVKVQNRVAQASALLPSEVTQSGVTTQKRQTSILLVASVYSPDNRYDQTFLQNYCDINIIPQIKRVSGVGEAQVFSTRTYAMRVWLKPEAMASYQLMPSDVQKALAAQNIEAAPGRFGQQNDQSYEYVIRYTGRLETEEQFGDIVIKSNPDGTVLRLHDVADLELGAQDYSVNTLTQGKEGVTMAIYQAAGSNAREVIVNCRKEFEKASEIFPPGVDYNILMDTNEFLDASIEEVLHTLFEAFLLVFIVVFVFLQDFRATIIPAIAVPVAIIGTFFFLNVLGYTINLLTLFAMVLAIGIVVDDAIVVVEAVHAKLDEGAKSAKEASISALSEISGAIVSITLVMCAVFIPVTFIQGSTGVFYQQFGVTLTVSILLSAVNALTLSPALCALFLKPHTAHGDENHKKSFKEKAFTAFNTAFDAFTNKYKQGTSKLLHRKGLAMLIILVFALIFGYLMKTTPSAFVPDEDTGRVFVDIQLPPATSNERTAEVAIHIDSIVGAQPEVDARTVVSGYSFIAGNGSSYAMSIIKLKPFEERSEKGHDQFTLMKRLYALTADIKDARIIVFTPPMVPGFSITGGFEMKLEDRTGGDVKKFEEVSKSFLAELNKRPEVKYASTSFSTQFPQYLVSVDAARCLQSGIQVSDALSALQGYIGGLYASDFTRFGKQYRVMLQTSPKDRAQLDNLNVMKIKTASGEMAPLSQFVTLEPTSGPESLTRFNLYTSIEINGQPADGYSTGEAIAAIEEVAAQNLPSSYSYEFSGITRQEIESGNSTGIIFLLSLIFVYFLLAAQYESYILPFAILLSLPIGLAGVFIFARMMGVSNNIYLQISMVMLIGLLAKNAILIVEYALQRRHRGMPLLQAALEGATARLRPILMTSFAFIIGLLPLIIREGVGSNGNKAIGSGAIGGLLIGTMFGIFVIPVLFVIFQNLQEKVSKKPVANAAEETKQIDETTES
ncbi:MAG: efflux RND transporter permease subunit [Mangrovibacterium sp.]